jgi:hypothetical protein
VLTSLALALCLSQAAPTASSAPTPPGDGAPQATPPAASTQDLSGAVQAAAGAV